MKRLVILLLTLSVITTGCFGLNKKEEVKEEKKELSAQKMSYSKLEEIVNNYSAYVDLDVVDVRSEDLYEEGHILGSINIPFEHLDEIIIDKKREIVIYGDTSSKSKQAANELIKLGYKKVFYIGGINNWPYDLEEY